MLSKGFWGLFHLSNCKSPEYNYLYEDGKVSRITQSNISLDSDERVTSQNIVNTIFFTYDNEGNVIRKRILDAEWNETVYGFEHTEEGGLITTLPTVVISHSKTDSMGRKVFDEIQLGTGFLSRQFSYYTGAITTEHRSRVLMWLWGTNNNLPFTDIFTDSICSSKDSITVSMCLRP